MVGQDQMLRCRVEELKKKINMSQERTPFYTQGIVSFMDTCETKLFSHMLRSEISYTFLGLM
jgi:hypothetical protein